MRYLIFVSIVFLFFLFSPTVHAAVNTNITDMNHYIQKYGFYTSQKTYTIPADELQRLQEMMPYALAATQKFNARYKQEVEPELLLWWTYSEGIGARINYSNCANEKADYFHHITNCDRPDFWQLGYGNQFANIDILPFAFLDMHGDPGSALSVQQVGQAVLDFDKSQNASPPCGGYSCTFPTTTIRGLMQDVHYAKGDKMTTNNWWASVLSRDPGINSYMDAQGLQVSRFNRQKAWSWGTYYQTHWQDESDKLATILGSWSKLGGCTNVAVCSTLSPSTIPLQPCTKGLDKAGHTTTDQTKIVICTNITTSIGDFPIQAAGIVSKIFSLLLSISGIVALLLIITSGYQLMMSQGNPEKVKGARERLTAAIVGLLFIIFSVAILQIVGVDILHIPGFR